MVAAQVLVMVDGRMRKLVDGLLVAAGLALLALTSRDGGAALGRRDNVPASDAGPRGGPRGSKPQPSFDTMIDSFATRLGAFAVLSIVAYPAGRAAMSIWAAAPYELPGLADQSDRALTYVFAGTLAFVTAVIGVLAAWSPIRFVMEQPVRRLYTALVAAIALALLVVALLVTGGMLTVQSRVSPLFGDLGDALDYAAPACDPAALTGVACEEAINRCWRDKLSVDACRGEAESGGAVTR